MFEDRPVGAIAEVDVAKADRALVDSDGLGAVLVGHFMGLQEGIDTALDIADALEEMHELHAQKTALRHNHQAQGGHHHKLAHIDLAQMPQVQRQGHQPDAQHNGQAVLQHADLFLVEERALSGLFFLDLVAVQIVEFVILAGEQTDAVEVAHRIDNLAGGQATGSGMFARQFLRLE